jgi:peptidoglycan/LPS O-acetylase OafA/YrhL
MNAAAAAASAPTQLPRRYRTALALLCIGGGITLGVLVAAQPFTPFTAPVFLLAAVLGGLVGMAGLRALEHSLE